MNREERLRTSLWDLFNKMLWLNRLEMEEHLKDYKSSEVHCMEYIGRNGDSNVTRLGQAFYMTNGAISKLMKKLIEKDLIESYQKPDNKKEIYFKLTGRGKAVYDLHQKLHKGFEERDRAVFEGVSGEFLEEMIGFAKRYSRHLDGELEKLGVKVPLEKLE